VNGRIVTALALGLGGLVVALAFTLGAFAIAGRDFSQPAGVPVFATPAVSATPRVGDPGIPSSKADRTEEPSSTKDHGGSIGSSAVSADSGSGGGDTSGPGSETSVIGSNDDPRGSGDFSSSSSETETERDDD
jgi:hypothetical protein